MQTVRIKSQEQVKKTIEETMIYFLAFAAYFENSTIEDQLYQICLKTNTTNIELQDHQFFSSEDLFYY